MSITENRKQYEQSEIASRLTDSFIYQTIAKQPTHVAKVQPLLELLGNGYMTVPQLKKLVKDEDFIAYSTTQATINQTRRKLFCDYVKDIILSRYSEDYEVNQNVAFTGIKQKIDIHIPLEKYHLLIMTEFDLLSNSKCGEFVSQQLPTNLSAKMITVMAKCPEQLNSAQKGIYKVGMEKSRMCFVNQLTELLDKHLILKTEPAVEPVVEPVAEPVAEPVVESDVNTQADEEIIPPKIVKKPLVGKQKPVSDDD